MRKLAGLILGIGMGMGWLLAATGPTATAQQTALASPAPKYSPVEVSFTYDYARANAGPGQCGCFNMNGGSTEVAFHIWQGFSAVADLTGERATGVSTAPESGLSLVAFIVGPRYSFRLPGKTLSRYTPFAQGLIGSVHGFDSQFPSSNATLAGSASSRAVLAGAGLDVTLTKYIAIRAIQADYLRTQLPNNVDNRQNILRLGAGIVLRAW